MKKSLAAAAPVTNSQAAIASEASPLDALWQETLVALESGSATDSLRLLRMCVFGGIEKQQAEKHLRNLLLQSAEQIRGEKASKELAENELSALLDLQREICSLSIAESADWLLLMQLAQTFPRPDNFVINGQALLNRLESGMPLRFVPEWPVILQELEQHLRQEEQILYRLQLVQILAGLEGTAEKYQALREEVRLLAEAKAVKVLGLAEVAVAVGDLDIARAHLDQVKAFDPEYSGLADAYKKLEMAAKIQALLARAAEAMRGKRFDEAIKLCNDVIKLDAHNIFARNMLQQIEDSRGRATGEVASAVDRQTLRLRRIEADLRKAEKEQDYLQIRQLIKEAFLIRSDMATYSSRLEQIEQEIALSRLYAEDRLNEAQKLFERGEYAALRLFLNRNPGLMSSLERMIQVWEMRLLANFYTSYLEPAELKSSAEELQKKARQSFAASFVLMKLAIADNKLADARRHYQEAFALNPKFAGLRWPGWLLWMHGDGRPAVVVALVILLFFMIKLIGPVFSWFESTYWTRIAIRARLFPSLALRSLEGCFGTFKDAHDREKLFRMLVKCSLACSDRKKALRYAENLLELRPHDSDALDILVPQWLSMTDIGEEKLSLIVAYAAKSVEKPEIIEKTAQLLKRNRKIRVDQIEFLKLYIGRYPEDAGMMELIGKSLLEIPAAEMPDSALAMIEMAWRRTESDELWWSLWRLLMFCGRFEQAVQITREVIDKGRPVAPSALLDVYDRDISADLAQVMSLLSLFDEKKVVEAVRSVKRFRYFNTAMAAEILQILEGLCREENADIASAAREAADHVRNRSRSSMAAIEKLLALQPQTLADQSDNAADSVPAEVAFVPEASEQGALSGNEFVEHDSAGVMAADQVEELFVADESIHEEEPVEEDQGEADVAAAFSFADINRRAADLEADDVISVGDLLANVGVVGSSAEPVATVALADAVADKMPEVVDEYIAASEDTVAGESVAVEEKKLMEPLLNDAEMVRISVARQRLFAELDALQAEPETSLIWREGLGRSTDRGRLFVDLD